MRRTVRWTVVKRAVQSGIVITAFLAAMNLTTQRWRDSSVFVAVGILFSVGYHGQAWGARMTLAECLRRCTVADWLCVAALLFAFVLSL